MLFLAVRIPGAIIATRRLAAFTKAGLAATSRRVELQGDSHPKSSSSSSSISAVPTETMAKSNLRKADAGVAEARIDQASWALGRRSAARCVHPITVNPGP
jgi:hypothetical protein